MKKHKFIDVFHCPDCIDKSIARAMKKDGKIKPQITVIGRKTFKALEGLL